MVTGHARVGVCVVLAACGGGPRDELLGSGGSGSLDDGPGSAGPAAGDDDDSDSAAGDDGLRLDVGPGGSASGADDGGPPPSSSCEAAAEDRSSIGCAFWAVDLPNAWSPSIWSPDAPNPDEMQFAVVVANSSSAEDANVTVHLGGELVDSATVTPATIHTFALPRNDINAKTTSTDGTAFLVESDVPIVAYQFQPLDNTVPPYSNDASLLFPVHAYGEDYVAVTSFATSMNMVHSDNPNIPSNVGSFVSVVASEDGTTVDMFPTAPLVGGPAKGVTIDRGQVFTIISDGAITEGQGNLSGTRVHADKPVAVFSGNVAAHEPLSIVGCCLDHVEHQLLPMSAWSDAYAIAPPPSYDGSRDESSVLRFTGAFDGTSLTYDPSRPPSAPTTIDAGQTLEIITAQPFTVSGTHPFSVVQFLQSNGTLAYGTSVPGDPAMWVVPPVAQHQANYVFLSPMGYERNFLTIVARGGTKIDLDGQPLAGQFVVTGELDGEPYLHIHVPVSPGSHVVEAEDPVGIAVFGYDTDVSYAYPGGSGLEYLYEPPPPPEG